MSLSDEEIEAAIRKVSGLPSGSLAAISDWATTMIEVAREALRARRDRRFLFSSLAALHAGATTVPLKERSKLFQECIDVAAECLGKVSARKAIDGGNEAK